MTFLKQQESTLIIVSVLIIIVIVAVFASYWGSRPHRVPEPNNTPSPTPSELNPAAPTISPTIPISGSPSVTPPLTLAPNHSLTSPSLPNPSPITLYPGEVREYQGQSLSSISDVYENAIAGTQYIDNATYLLEVSGLLNKTLLLSYSDVIANHQLYQKVVTIYCVEGWDATILWEGVLVKDLLQEAGADPNASTIIFRAADGYTTSMPKDYLVNNNIILAYKMNGLTIPPERGFPFELVAENKYGYKWIKWVTGIEISNNGDYLGYWESRGYPNDGSIS